MKVVIMAGGKGTRISSVASDIPKPMIKIEGKPVLEHEVDKLTKEQLLELLRFANAGASLITTRKGALKVMPNRQEIQDLMQSEIISEA